MTVYLPTSHSHCTRARFIGLVLCSDEIVVPSCIGVARVAKEVMDPQKF